MASTHSVSVKLISLGNSRVGKSSLIKRYCEKRFLSKYIATIGIDYGLTRVHLKDAELKVNIFDTSGNPLFYEIRNEFYNDNQGALLVYDAGSRDTFEALDDWLSEMSRCLMPRGSLNSVVCAVCANKVEPGRLRVVSESEGRSWAVSHGCLYFETSAQTGQGVVDMFESLLAAMVGRGEGDGCRTSRRGRKDQAEAVMRIRGCRDAWDTLGLRPGTTREEITRAYHRLAILLHPDKSSAPGCEEAFKAILHARNQLLYTTR
uniref:dnaJ homolog subfamily C member 27 isoform X2 n=1 Tax=Myxine glutinosa TaxID=7769 RepID=UPI00358EC325